MNAVVRELVPLPRLPCLLIRLMEPHRQQYEIRVPERRVTVRRRVHGQRQSQASCHGSAVSDPALCCFLPDIIQYQPHRVRATGGRLRRHAVENREYESAAAPYDYYPGFPHRSSASDDRAAYGAGNR